MIAGSSSRNQSLQPTASIIVEIELIAHIFHVNVHVHVHVHVHAHVHIHVYEEEIEDCASKSDGRGHNQ